MSNAIANGTAQLFLKYFIVFPLLLIIRLIDSAIGLIYPRRCVFTDQPDINSIFAKLTNKNDPSSPYRSVCNADLIGVDDINTTLYSVFEKSCKDYPKIKTMGVREVFSIEEEQQSNGNLNILHFKCSNILIIY
jgi:hypothetical protein